MKTLDFPDVVFATDCSQPAKMVSSPDEWPAFATHLEEFRCSKSSFPSFKIQHIPRATNLIADKLVRGDWSFLSAVFYADSTPPSWIFESIGSLSLF